MIRIQNDPWAMKAIKYLARMNYNIKEILEAIATAGIKNEKEEEKEDEKSS